MALRPPKLKLEPWSPEDDHELHRAKQRKHMAGWRAANPERAKAISRAHYARNPEARITSTRKWAANNRATVKRIKFASSLKKYGITVEDWARAFHAQEGRCAGCRDLLGEGWKTAVDHCHRTGKFRGLLCIRCNRSLGVLLERPETLRRLASYLEAHR